MRAAALSHASHDSAYSWLRLAVSLAIATIGNAGMWVVVVILPAVQTEFAAGRGEVSLVYTLTMLGFAAGNLLIGRAVDRFGVVRALTVAAVGLAAGFAAASFSPSLSVLALLHFAVGFGTAASFGPLIADVSHWFLRRRGVAVAIAACGNYLAGAIWPILLADIMAEAGWRGVYLWLAGLTLVLMLPLTVFLRRRLPEDAAARADAAAAERALTSGFPPRVLAWMLALAGIGCCVAMSMPQVHIVAYCVDLGYGPAVGAEMLSLMLMGGVVSRLISGLLMDRLGGVVTLLIGSGLQMIALFLYLPYTGLVSLYVVSLIFGLAQGGIVPSYAVIVREYMPAKEAGAWVGFVIMATILGMALGGWMSGWIYEITGSYRAAFLNGIAWNALNLGIVAMLLLRTRRPRPAAA